MKLMLNGAVTLGTMDGANVEIVRQAGLENNYIFGATVQENNAIRDTYNPRGIYDSDARIRRAMDSLIDGTVATDDELRELHGAIVNGTSWHRADNYYHLNDFNSYREARLRALNDYKDRVAFGRKCLENIAAAGMFSSDRAVRQYAEKIWNV
jgi:starch phosphorylase